MADDVRQQVRNSSNKNDPAVVPPVPLAQEVDIKEARERSFTDPGQLQILEGFRAQHMAPGQA